MIPISVILVVGAGGVKGALCNGRFLQDGEQDNKLSWSKVGGGPVIYFRRYWKINHINSYKCWIFGDKDAKGHMPLAWKSGRVEGTATHI